jgi:hypothetical protein
MRLDEHLARIPTRLDARYACQICDYAWDVEKMPPRSTVH